MARGWESKSVEAQIEQSFASQPGEKPAPLAPEDIGRQQHKASLRLSRSRVAQQLEASQSERYSEMLRHALFDLDARIAALGD